MFTTSTCDTAASVAASLAGKHTKLVPISTQMNALLEPLIYPITAANVEWTVESIPKLIDTLRHTASENEDGNAKWQSDYDEYVESFSRSIHNNLLLTRKVALPLIDSIYDTAKSRIVSIMTTKRGANDLTIIPSTEFALVDNAMFIELITKHGGSNFKEVVSQARVCSLLDHDELLRLIKTGHDEFDELLLKTLHIPSRSEDVTSVNNYLVNVWKEYFVNPETLTRLDDFPKSSLGGAFKQAVIGFFLANGLLNNELPEGISVSRDELRSIMARYRGYWGYTTNRYVRTFTAKRDNGILVIDRYLDSNDRKVIVVVDTLFERLFNEHGIDAQVLHGYHILGIPKRENNRMSSTINLVDVWDNATWHVDDIINKKQQAQDAYDAVYNDISWDMSVAIRNTLKDTLYDEIADRSRGKYTILDDSTDTAVEFNFDGAITREAINNTVKLYTNYSDDEQLLSVIETVVCQSLFKDTLVPELITRMSATLKLTKDREHTATDVNYHALLAVMSICIDSLYSNFKPVLNIT